MSEGCNELDIVSSDTVGWDDSSEDVTVLGGRLLRVKTVTTVGITLVRRLRLTRGGCMVEPLDHHLEQVRHLEQVCQPTRFWCITIEIIIHQIDVHISMNGG